MQSNPAATPDPAAILPAMPLSAAIKRAGLQDAFIARATRDTLNSELEAWCKKQPALKNAIYPYSLSSLRKSWKCTCKPGGKRPGPGRSKTKGYTVWGKTGKVYQG